VYPWTLTDRVLECDDERWLDDPLKEYVDEWPEE
jgi:hypothetical protein